jgi:hypothetical protein
MSLSTIPPPFPGNASFFYQEGAVDVLYSLGAKEDRGGDG